MMYMAKTVMNALKHSILTLKKKIDGGILRSSPNLFIKCQIDHQWVELKKYFIIDISCHMNIASI